MAAGTLGGHSRSRRRAGVRRGRPPITLRDVPRQGDRAMRCAAAGKGCGGAEEEEVKKIPKNLPKDSDPHGPSCIFPSFHKRSGLVRSVLFDSRFVIRTTSSTPFSPDSCCQHRRATVQASSPSSTSPSTSLYSRVDRHLVLCANLIVARTYDHRPPSTRFAIAAHLAPPSLPPSTSVTRP